MHESTNADDRQARLRVLRKAMALALISLSVFTANYVAQKYLQQNQEWAQGLALDIGTRSLELPSLYRKARAGDSAASAALRQDREAISRDIAGLREGEGLHPGYAGAVGLAAVLDELGRDEAGIHDDIEIVLRAKDAPPAVMAHAAPDIADGSARLAADARSLHDGFDRLSARRLFPSRYFAVLSGGLAMIGLLMAVRAGQLRSGTGRRGRS